MKLSAFLIPIALIFLISCQGPDGSRLTQTEYNQVQDSVRQMASQIAADVTLQGPIAWLSHFSDTTGFFMAAEGQLMFPTYDSASVFVRNTVVKMIKKIELTWSDVRVDPLTTKLAVLGAVYKEVVTYAGGQVVTQPGYFTGVAEWTRNGWKLRDAHWSNLAPAPRS